MRTYSLIVLMFFTLISSSLTGCATTDPKVIYKTEVVAPDDNLLVDCDVQEPPNKEEYIAATPKDREKMLVDKISLMMKDGFTCNKRFETLRKWKADSLRVLEKSSTMSGE